MQRPKKTKRSADVYIDVREGAYIDARKHAVAGQTHHVPTCWNGCLVLYGRFFLPLLFSFICTLPFAMDATVHRPTGLCHGMNPVGGARNC